jgi:CSLREA domain-containing protein
MIKKLVCGRRRPSAQPVEEMTSYRCSRLAVVTVSIAMQAVVATIGASPAYANFPYFVNSLADTVSSDGRCTLREAMLAAANLSGGDCGPGSPEFDTIFIFVPGTIVLERELPDITDGVAILGHASGGTTIDGNTRVRPFVISGSGQLSSVVVRLEKLTITNAKAPNGSLASPRGEDGGAIHNTAQLFLTDVRITHSAAGNGGAGVGEGGHGGAIYNAGGIVAIA